jgi:hypothetical protein
MESEYACFGDTVMDCTSENKDLWSDDFVVNGDKVEWFCDECKSFGIYAEIRKVFNSGAALCCYCKSEVKCIR